MAFNPFNIFRRNQRALFAVVTVFIMFTFVLSSGLGGGADFFDWFPAWFGKNRGGDHICTIDGSKVKQGELDKLRFRRAMANRFMELAMMEAEENVQTTLAEKAKNITPQFRNMIPIVLQNPQLIEMLLDETPNKPKPLGLQLSADEKDVLRGVQALNAIQQVRQMAVMSGRNYFFNAPNRSNRDLVEFLLWEKKAQQMDIRFTEDDIKALIRKEFYGQFKNDVLVRKQLEKDMQGFTLESCLKAIGDEFRVRTVQSALLGPMTPVQRDDSTLSAPPMFTPPYEMYDFYRDRVSPTTYWVVAVPGANFTERVTGTPSESELRDLFSKYANQEYDPSREEPGFRQPRKIKVDWVQVHGNEPYYQKKAQEWVAEAEKIRKTEIGALAVPLPGVGPGFVGLAVAPVAATDPLIWGAYQTVDYYHKGSIRIDWESSQYVLRPLDTSIVRPQNLVAAAGGSVGGLIGFGGPFQPLSAVYGRAMLFEQGDRVKAGMPLFFAMPGPGLEATVFGGAVGTKLGAPATIPIEAYRPMLLKQITDDKARSLALADLQKLRKDLTEIAKDTKLGLSERTAKARETVAAFVKERGLTTGSTTDYRDEWTIADDAGMAPLKAALKPGATGTPSAPLQFGKKFFWTDDFTKINFRDPRAMEMIQSGNVPKMPATGRYQPEFFPQEPSKLSETDPTFLFCRTDEQDSKPVTFDQAKNSGALLAAWKRIKARELAKGRAEAIAERLKGRGASLSGPQILQNVFDEDKILRDEFRGNDKAVDRVKLFDIDNVAPLAPATETNQFGGSGKTVRPFRLDASSNLPFPTPDFEKLLLEHRTDAPGSVFVIADKPKDTYYVVTLTRRQVLTPREFNSEVYSASAQQSGVGQGVRRAFVREQSKAAHDSVIDLLKKEFNYVETEEQKKKLESNAKDDVEL